VRGDAVPIALDGWHGYEIEDRPGATLYVGVQPGQVRPTVWIVEHNLDEQGIPLPGPPRVATLASFHGEKHALALVHFLDTMTAQINRAVAHYKNQHPNHDTGEPDGD
jgi:hypothetical protein